MINRKYPFAEGAVIHLADRNKRNATSNDSKDRIVSMAKQICRV